VEERTDDELLRDARAQTNSAAQRDLLDQLFSRYHSRIALWCLRITGNADSAGDLAQEVLFKAYQNLDSFRGASKFSTWLYSITRNHCFNDAHRRAARREQEMEPLDIEIASQDRFDLRLEQEQDREQIRELLQQTLDETEHRVMILHYSDELTLDAITRLLGLTNPSGAKAYIVSARRKLKTAVGRWRARQTGGGSHE
jgi:RNA polymerase sigma factor (sigma-70 family)